MAGAWNLASTLAFILQSILAVNTSDIVSYCWHGNIEAQRTLRNETCATGKISLPNIRESSISTHSPLVPQNLSKVTAGKALSVTAVKHCMIFKYMIHSELGATDKYKTYETSIYANYTCDHVGLCDAAKDEEWQHNVSYKGVHGDVYCCNRSNCNIDVPGIMKVPPQQQMCYQGSNATQEVTGKLISCLASEAICAHSTWIRDADRAKVSSYFCDNSKKCKANGLTEKHTTCKMVREDNTNKTQQLCCCSRNKCNVLPWPLTDKSNYEDTGSDASLQWLIAGTIILLTFLVGVGAGVAVAVIRNRKKKNGDNHTAMMYRRIAADEATRTGDEDHLII